MPRKFLATQLLVLACVLPVASCAIRSNVPDGAPVESGSGILAMQVTANVDANLSYVDYSPVSTFGTRFAENMVGPNGSLHFRKGDNYWVIVLPQGDYMWSKFTYGNLFSNIQSSNHFVVNAGAITYIGHLYIDADLRRGRFHIHVGDDSIAMKQYLDSNYPSYSATLPFQEQVAQIMHVTCGRTGFSSCSNSEATEQAQ